MAYNRSTPNYQPSRFNSAGDVVISGSLTVTGSTVLTDIDCSGPTLSVTGSTYMSASCYLTPTLVIIGSTFMSGTQDPGTPTLQITGSTILSGTAGSTNTTLYVTGTIRMSSSLGENIPTITRDVPADNMVVRWSGTSGYLIQTSSLWVQDAGAWPSTAMAVTNGFNSGSVAVGNTDTSGAMVYYSSVSDGPLSSSHFFVADVNKDTIDIDHTIARFGWQNTTDTFSSSWSVKPWSIESCFSSSAEMLGTCADGASSIGCIAGSSASYVTAGSKLLSVQNAGVERESVDYAGGREWGISDYESSVSDLYWNELVSITGSLFNVYTTVNTVPAGASIMGVGVRVRTTFPTASYFSVGLTGSCNEWGYSMASNAGVTNSTSSLANGWTYCATNTNIWLSSSVKQNWGGGGAGGSVTGSVRVECRYRVMNPMLS